MNWVIVIGSDLPGYGMSPAFIAVVGLILLLALGILIGVALRTRKQALVSGDAGLLGSLARVSAVDPHTPLLGWVHAQGEDWQAQCTTPLHVGQTVRVLARNGVQLTVSAAADSSAQGD